MASPTADIEQLFANLQAGDPLAMEKLLEKLEPDLRRYARRNCKSADVDEAVQDALLIVYKRAGALKFLVALSSWLFKIVFRICLRLKKKAFGEHLDFTQVDDEELSQMQTFMLQQELSRMLMKIESHYSEILILRDFLGYTAEETAEKLNISIEAAKSRLHRARVLARRELQD